MANANAPAPNTTTPYGLPQRITTTYDHFGFERHQVKYCSPAHSVSLLGPSPDLVFGHTIAYRNVWCAAQAVTYNAHIYLTALKAAKALAEAVDDTATLAEIEKSYEISQAAIVDDRLWNATSKFFRCHTKDGGEGDNQIFTDSLYGQMLR